MDADDESKGGLSRFVEGRHFILDFRLFCREILVVAMKQMHVLHVKLALLQVNAFFRPLPCSFSLSLSSRVSL